MIYVLNKNKIISYIVSSFIILGLFTFSTRVVPNDVELVKVSSNSINENNIKNNSIENNY